MTGNGTQETPYIPENWADFVTACETSGAYVSVPQGTVYEFNEIAPAGFSGTICTGTNLTIYGNGLTINNLRYIGKHFFGDRKNNSLFDINFTNMYFTSGFFAGDTSNSTSTDFLNFYHCRFSGEFYENSSFCLCNQNIYFRDTDGKGCSFNLAFYDNAIAFNRRYNYSYIYNGNVKLSGESTASMQGIYAYDSQFTGKMPFSSVAFSTADRCIFDMDIENISKSSGTSVLNSDRLTGTQSGFLTADSQQIRNAEYLRNIGFPIGV